jgi:peptidoglycan/LPS O-acetylase OafA/YrhL
MSATPPELVGTTQASSGRRLTALDGLRGIAALVVVVDHSMLSTTLFGGADYVPWNARRGGVSWWLTDTPLHLPWAGTEAVYFFFVLSGFVLALPIVKGKTIVWRDYYVRRLVRLYLPVWAALLFALLLTAIHPWHAVPGSSAYLRSFAMPYSIHDVIHDGALLGNTGYLDSVLWSLKWEVIFSLALPAYIFASRRWRSLWPIKAAILVLMIAVGMHANNGYVGYLPMFGLGTLLAVEHDRIIGWIERLRDLRNGRMLFPALGVVCVVLLTCSWTYVGLHPQYDLGWRSSILVAFEVVGATVLLVLGLSWPLLQRGAESAPVQWVGRRSYSLYLVHEPIVVSVAYLLGGRAVFPVVLVIALPLSLMAAYVFYAVIEGPCQKLAHQAGHRFARITEPVFRKQLPPGSIDTVVREGAV